MKIGVGITTHNRPNILWECITHWEKCVQDDNTVFVIVDDASEDKFSIIGEHKDRFHIIRHEEAKGVAGSKNACLSFLMKQGCTDIFLFDDDTWPISKDWWKPYVGSEQKHLMYLWDNNPPFYKSHKVKAYKRPKGCMLYATRDVVESVGGMDESFGKWGFEHENWSDRIYNAGHTMCRYMDVNNSDQLIYACDKERDIESSVPEEVRRMSKPEIAEQKRDVIEYIEYEGEDVKKNNIKLSVLIPSVSSRWNGFAQKIQDQVYGAIATLPEDDQPKVEVVMLVDNKTINLGHKRNKMVEMASGEYVVFVDDDDRISPDYFKEILAKTDGADCITFKAMVTINGGGHKECIYSIDWEKDHDTATHYHRIPNHICAVKRKLALRTPFPSLLCGEDAEYAKDLKPLLKTSHHIDKVLYFYDYNDKTTETQVFNKAQGDIVRASRPAVMDVVFLSKASTPELEKMTQKAIDTCISGAKGYNLNIVVVEQVEGVKYKGTIACPVTTTLNQNKFHYNQFANAAIETGSAPWVMVANNDLEFEDGWLKALMDLSHDCMSPISKKDSRQQNLRSNESGYINGRHFSGWCFVLKRKVWEQIGGLDSDFGYWCADDSVIEQLRRIRVTPTVVFDSRVNHLVSVTGSGTPPDEMSWAYVHKFEQKYGIKKFQSDTRYAAWKKKNNLN